MFVTLGLVRFPAIEDSKFRSPKQLQLKTHRLPRPSQTPAAHC
jgi:hypothetical protein